MKLYNSTTEAEQKAIREKLRGESEDGIFTRAFASVGNFFVPEAQAVVPIAIAVESCLVNPACVAAMGVMVTAATADGYGLTKAGEKLRNAFVDLGHITTLDIGYEPHPWGCGKTNFSEVCMKMVAAGYAEFYVADEKANKNTSGADENTVVNEGSDGGNLKSVTSKNGVFTPVGSTTFTASKIPEESKKEIEGALDSGDNGEIRQKVKEEIDLDIPEEALDKLPDDMNVRRVAKNGKGIKIDDKEQGETKGVRIMKGDEESNNESQKKDYVQIRSGGKVIGRGGKVIEDGQDGYKKASHHPDAHISKDEWTEWRQWDKP